MNISKLAQTASELVGGDKGLIAMDESTPTCNRRFAELEIPQNAETRRAYREMIVTTPMLGRFVSGAILFDETIGQVSKEGQPLLDIIIEAGIIPGIKVDLGTVGLAGFPGEKITEGLDGLRERLAVYAAKGLRFAKWRAIVNPNKCLPSVGCVNANAQSLARYAAICQELSIVPIVEMEVLMDGDENLERCAEVTEQSLRAVFNQLAEQRVALEGLILKPNMVIGGLHGTKQETVNAVADSTVNCLLRVVPAAVPGIAFLSGGQTSELASARLNAMNMRFKDRLPWRLTFSFSRALQHPALEIWGGREANVRAAQKALYHRAKCNSAASLGNLDLP
jgi:fructose-bisphosphate aldolase class I